MIRKIKWITGKIGRVILTEEDAKLWKRIVNHAERDFRDWQEKYEKEYNKTGTYCPPWLDLTEKEQKFFDDLFHLICPGEYCTDPLSFGQVNRWMYEQFERKIIVW